MADKYYIKCEDVVVDLDCLAPDVFYMACDCSYIRNPSQKSLEVFIIGTEKDYEAAIKSIEALGIKPTKTFKIDPAVEPRLYNSIKSGVERRDEVEQFKMMYDKNNVGLVMDEIISREVEIMEQSNTLKAQGEELVTKEEALIVRDNTIIEKEAALFETKDLLQDACEQLYTLAKESEEVRTFLTKVTF